MSPFCHSRGLNGQAGRAACQEILEREVKNLLDTTYFLCGSPAFMEVARTLLQEMNVESSRILQESFGGAVAGAAELSPTAGSLE